MPDQDDTVQWLRARILALEAERPTTASGALAKYAAIQELEEARLRAIRREQKRLDDELDQLLDYIAERRTASHEQRQAHRGCLPVRNG